MLEAATRFSGHALTTLVNARFAGRWPGDSKEYFHSRKRTVAWMCSLAEVLSGLLSRGFCVQVKSQSTPTDLIVYLGLQAR